jgi:hypothetical protein
MNYAAATATNPYGLTKRQRLMVSRAQLLLERSSFDGVWRDCGDNVLPHRMRFQISEANRGERRNLSIIDSTATFANRTLGSGLTSGVTNPSRPWYRLTTPDPELAEFGAVKYWLHDYTNLMRGVHIRSNAYNIFPTAYEDLGAFGTAAIMVERHPTRVMHLTSFPIGSYCVAKNRWGEVDTFFREFRYTVRQLVHAFGRRNPKSGSYDWSMFSEHVKNQWDNAHYESWVDVCHMIWPNEEFNPNSPLARDQKYAQCYWERGTGANATDYLKQGYDDNRYLDESGFDYFPVLVPRWKVTAEDVYATSWPTLDALGDIKQLQLGEKRGMQAIEKMVNPPMVGPPELRQSGYSTIPGGITWLTEREGMKGYRPAYEVTPRIQELEMKQEACRFRINRAYFADLFLMLANVADRQRTAREIEERHEEKLLALGPVLEQLNQDLLDPFIELSARLMEEAGMIPPPPEEVAGQDLKVEYISMMAQAQKLVGVAGMERYMTFMSRVAAETQDPTVLDKVNKDQFADDYGDALGVSPKMIRSDDEVEEIRGSRAEAANAERQAMMAREAAGAVKDLSASVGPDGLAPLIRQSQAGNLVPGVA